ncbi:MAG: hypothetical protein R2834_03415 [Rhodothermales bacterium]
MPSRTTRRAILPLIALVAVLAGGCASVNYVGDEYTPTADVDIYYSEAAIARDYDLIGHGLGSGFWVKNRKIQGKLIEEAKEKGADAILVTGLGKSNVIISNGISADEKQMNVVFLRYKQ